ncbi:cilia- and flagella-associated protein 52 [Plutella xylostella]|uniref:cilia- and flagella-associated protein 52 n=1 Tax=Plutella xylostella TaxID=51655 RepID=UPI002032AF09|nr:cilia- and flagella-associated protein 52 [Plutella xylostella]
MAKEVKSLEAHAIIGFDGSAIKGLKVHPDGEHIIYPMGNKVCIQHWKSKQMHFLSGHSNSVSTVAVSFDGKYIGSGQINHIGFKALVILWDFQKKIKIGSHELHKVRVEALTFSSDARFLISLGGRDDGALVLWNCEAGAATATAPAARLTTGDATCAASLNKRPNAFVTGGDSKACEHKSEYEYEYVTATTPAARLTTGDATCAASLNKRPNAFVTGGDSNLRVWSMHPGSSSLEVVDVALGKLRRCVRSLAIADDDSIGYAGTTSGDIIKFSINYPADLAVPVDTCKPALIGCLAKCGRQKKNQKPEAVCYSQGVESILLMSDGCLVVGGGDGSVDALREGGCRAAPKTRLCQPTAPSYKAVSLRQPPSCSLPAVASVGTILLMSDGCLVVGGGDGSVDALREGGCRAAPKTRLCQPTAPSYKALRSVKLPGSITSLELMESDQMQGDNRILLAGTRTSEIYAINVKTFEAILVVTCHRCAINDIAFPKGMSGVFATAGAGSARVWSAASAQELLRIEVPNFVCSAVLFTADGKSLVTAWNDGCIRAFTPLTGRLMYCILNTHNKGASALDMTTDGTTLVSGGCEGQVRVWDIKPQCQTLKKVLKEHKSPVSAIQVSPNNCEAVSAGTDGSCIIWDLISLSRRRVLYANTLFSCARYEPGGCQLLTAGSDRRVACWETATGTLAREVGAIYSDCRILIVAESGSERERLILNMNIISPRRRVLYANTLFSCARYEPGGCQLLTAGSDRRVACWETATGTLAREKQRPPPSSPRRRVLYANTLFSCARYEPGGCQLLTAGSDRRVACWETATGTLARELEASKVGAVNGLDISYNGELFATGANDQMVKLWKYQEGIYTHTGLGHAGAVTCLRFSPDMRYIVSCCAAGSIVIWKMPAEYIPKTPPPTPASEISLKLPSAPSKDEKIEKMNTSRSSVHACCPCEPPKNPSRASVQSSGDSAKSGGSRGSKGSGGNDWFCG